MTIGIYHNKKKYNQEEKLLVLLFKVRNLLSTRIIKKRNKMLNVIIDVNSNFLRKLNFHLFCANKLDRKMKLLQILLIVKTYN